MMSVQASMVRELVSKLVALMNAEIDNAKDSEGNIDVRVGMEKAQEILRQFEER